MLKNILLPTAQTYLKQYFIKENKKLNQNKKDVLLTG